MSLQEKVGRWVSEIGLETHPKERALRVCEEAFELAQAVGVDSGQLHVLVDYIFSRDKGSPPQELAGTMLALLAMANTLGVVIEDVTTKELERVSTPEKISRIKRRDLEKMKEGVGFSLDSSKEG